MKRALVALATVLGLAALYRFLFVKEVRLSEDWLREMAAAEGREDFAREMDGARVIVARPPASNGGPPDVVSRYTEVVK